MITDAELIHRIAEHDVLHDLISHIGDFKTACVLAAAFSLDDSDEQYWKKQVAVIERLEEFIKKYRFEY